MSPWRSYLPLFLLVSLIPSFVSAHSFENTAIVRTVELGGSLVHVTTTYAIKALESGANNYVISLGEEEHQRTSWLEVKIKGKPGRLPLESTSLDPAGGSYLYNVDLPESLKAGGATTLVVETVQTHAARPYPEEATQKEGQSLKYEADLLVLSPYSTVVQRTKIRSPSPKIHSYSTPESMDEFTLEAPVTKSGATLTYGPYKNIPPSSNEAFLEQKQKRISIRYNYDSPVLEVTKLKRAAEISHWGANLNIQDVITLHNAGPRLKGHFSRFEYAHQNYYGSFQSHTINSLALHLPPGIHDVYYYDLIGNVSTSKLRTAPSIPKGATSSQSSLLELKPRYPLLGGWNFSFTLGWDSPLRDSAGYDAKSGKWVVGIPVMTLIPGAVVNEAEVQILLPEGATDIDFFPPFPASANVFSTEITYLDTVGRPAISLHYENLTDKHTGIIYVTYKVPFTAHLRKPIAVAAAFSGLFVLALIWKRVDVRVQKQKQK